MTAGSPKSIHNPCPICGKPRGKGKYEFAHGECAIEVAKQEVTRPKGPGITGLDRLSHEDKRAAVSHNRKKQYKLGNLPP